MSADEPPSERNEFHCEHAALLIDNLYRWTGRSPVDLSRARAEQARALYFAPCVVLSHDTADDPILTYCNRAGLELFELSWSEMRATPSRLTAEPLHRDERQRLLATVAELGFVDDYCGVRISRSGRRFRIERATVWNLLDGAGAPAGQAAQFDRWVRL